MKSKDSIREKPIPENKKKLVKELAEKMISQSVLIASTRGLPASQFQAIKKKLRGQAEVYVLKKSLMERAISQTGKSSLEELRKCIEPDIAVIFSKIDQFELASILVESESPTKAKVGDIAPEDITIESGPTELVPGPAISELGSVGLKVAVENGKLAIKTGATIVKKDQ